MGPLYLVGVVIDREKTRGPWATLSGSSQPCCILESMRTSAQPHPRQIKLEGKGQERGGTFILILIFSGDSNMQPSLRTTGMEGSVS